MTRILGYLFASLALLAFAIDVWRGPMQQQELVFTSTAEYWNEFHVTSLIGLNSFIEKEISPALWDQAVLPAISWPAFVLGGLFSLLFFLLAGRRRKTGREGLMFPKGRR